MIYDEAVGTTTGPALSRFAIGVALALAEWLAPMVVHAAELGDTVWIPLVDPEKGAEETFAQNTLGLIHEGEGANADWRICRGKYRESVSRHDFFITVGRPDLARRESSRNSKHNWMVLGGIAGIIAGPVVLGASFSKGGWDPPWALGAGLIAGGAISYFASDIFAGPDLKVDEADGLVRRYNERLLDRLRPPERESRIQAAVQSIELAPWIAPGSGGLGFAARF